MKNTTKYLTCAACIVLINFAKTAGAQPHKKVAARTITPAPAKANYITLEITKKGAGDHGIFYDTLSGRMKPTDLVNPAGKPYQDIHLTLGAGDVISTDLHATNGDAKLSLLNTVNGQLKVIKAVADSSGFYIFKLLYQATDAGSYTLRVNWKKKAPKDKYGSKDFYENESSYSLNCIIATPESGQIADNAEICDQVQFLVRQQQTRYKQITGTIVDTSMDVLDKKKIGYINHNSSFTFYKNSKSQISIDPNDNYAHFVQDLLYSTGDDAEKAQTYFIAKFKECLGDGWVGAQDPDDATAYQFKKTGYNSIDIILFAQNKYIMILM